MSSTIFYRVWCRWLARDEAKLARQVPHEFLPDMDAGTGQGGVDPAASSAAANSTVMSFLSSSDRHEAADAGRARRL